jgi:site-specific DNA-methyltransferase (adenine-specific)
MDNLIHGDCLEEMPKLPAKSFDLIIADPPYVISGTSTNGRFVITDSLVLKGFFAEFFIQAERVLKDNGALFLFCDWRTYPVIWYAASSSSLRPTNLIVWDYGWIKAGQGFRYTHELIFYLTKEGTASPHNRSISDVWRMPPINFTAERRIETEKPEKLIEFIIKNTFKSNDDKAVLDPFAGSATVGSVCKRLGINSTSIELNPIHYKIAKKRIDETKRIPELSFWNEKEVTK